ncbi:hypothetical protein VNO77_21620 [Canavalia gladiata]|uniref:Uncharacterized protein n=1 Tax=Canavalia gladiata TaxID=3824 RepID=A0AAN9LVM7_CANGL
MQSIGSPPLFPLLRGNKTPSTLQSQRKASSKAKSTHIHFSATKPNWTLLLVDFTLPILEVPLLVLHTGKE